MNGSQLALRILVLAIIGLAVATTLAAVANALT